eukprot:gb/GEZN01015652.1/.p1 GENE.gb/GEZN01015652.1/~~gb/GEZN01015652.1/.p1  ORF type:complete len:149 (+),score=10.17 gb/GEZN01015652.1/:36-449(+)
MIAPRHWNECPRATCSECQNNYCGALGLASNYQATGIGLLQWSYGRRTNFENFCAQAGGYACDSLSKQLDFLGTEPDWGRVRGCFMTSGKAMGDPSEPKSPSGSYWACAREWTNWEDPNNQVTRRTYANNYLNELQC